MDRVADYIASHYEGRVVEVGVGNNTRVADLLRRRGLDVTLTDVEDHAHEDFVRDDVTRPDPEVYRDASLIYSVRPPYELHRPLHDVAEEVEADLLIVPLSGEDSPLEYDLVNHDGRPLYLVRPE